MVGEVIADISLPHELYIRGRKRLCLIEIPLHALPSPALIAHEFRPVLEVPATCASKGHSVHGAPSSDDFAGADDGGAAIEAVDGGGGGAPEVVERRGRARAGGVFGGEEDVEEFAFAAGSGVVAGFDHEHGDAGVFGEAGGYDEAGGAGADDDEVVGVGEGGWGGVELAGEGVGGAGEEGESKEEKPFH